MDKKQKLVGSFLGDWVVTNVHAEGRKEPGNLTTATRLADQCVALAAAQGIHRAAFEDQVGDLAEHMRKAQNIAQALSEAMSRSKRG